MAAHSTLRFEVLGERRCSAIMHPCTRSCSVFYLNALSRSLRSCSAIIGVLYGLPVVWKILKDGFHLKEIQEWLTSTFRTSSFLSLHISISLGLACLFRALIGKFTQYTTILIPSTLGSLSFLLEDATKRNITLFMYGSALLERNLHVLSRATGVPLGRILVPLFMVISSTLLYLLRLPHVRCLVHGTDNAWFFYPPPLKDEGRPEGVHTHTLRPQLMETARLLAAGLVLQVARVAILSACRPGAFIARLRRFDTYGMSLFPAVYSALYQVCSWALVRARGRDAAWHAVPAGLLAGLTLRLYPHPTMVAMAATTTLQIFAKWFCKKINAKNIFVWKVIFLSLIAGNVVHFHSVDPDSCPSWLRTMLDSSSGGVSAELRTAVFKLWHSYRFPVVVAGI